MKSKLTTLAVVALLLSAVPQIQAQSFTNLDFESANVAAYGAGPAIVAASNAIPGWTEVSFISPNMLFNTVSLGSTSVSLFGNNGVVSSLGAAYSIDLYGGGGITPGASISQTGLVPANAASIRFIAQPPNPLLGGQLLISLGGQNIPFVAIGAGPNYTVYGGNISGFAGSVEQLTFTAMNGVNNYWELDNIQFSASAIPEPGALGLFGLGALLMSWRFLRKPS